ncbi:MAG: hypothetical protein PVSMB3_04010 [Candidatus Dormibacteraceae bacterium]
MKSRFVRACVPLVVLVVALAADHPALAAPSSASSHVAAALTLPADRLHFGLANGPDNLGWMTGSGVPWRYRYQYLAGGVNTGTGWETWNSPSGAFASYYMTASGNNSYLPVFTYYELLQSNPSTGANESDRDFSNLNNAATMAAYFANFKLLMQMVAAYNKTVVVHVEPDLWGYLQQRAAGGDASSVSASVGSSGFADVAGIPNTAQGFGWALLKLRDLYGANAVMALHASGWANGIDIDTSTDPSVNPVAVADSTAAFLNSTGISANPYGSSWDLVFNDLDDHDAGWWEKQGSINQWYTHWWDPTNVKFPNFNRYLAWVAELRAKTGRPQVAWQVPVGNQYFLTMNQTCGHYQDNVAEYFISHPADLFAAGIIAVLFGAGNACQTTNTDAQKDGVTNGTGVPTSAGYCNACNTHTSVWPDDDGGYLRIFVGQYYLGQTTAGWTSLNGILTTGPGASSWGAGRTDVFAVGLDRALWQNTFNGTAWAGWAPLGGIVTDAPGAVSWGAGRIDVFVRGQDGALYHRYSDGASWFGGWEGLGGGMRYGPRVASMAPQRLDIFITGNDNQLWHKFWSGGWGWSGWEPLGGVLMSAPAVTSWGSNRLDIFARGADNQIWHFGWAGSGWFGWEPLGGQFVLGPAAASCTPGHLDNFAVGTDQSLWRDSWNGAQWSGWQRQGGYWTSDPAAVCPPGTTSVSVFERAVDNAIWRANYPGA